MPISWVKDRPKRLFLIFGAWFGKRMSHASWCWRKLSILQKSCVFNIGQRRKIKMSVMANYPNIRYTSESWRKRNWQTSTFEPLDYTRCTTMYVSYLFLMIIYSYKRNRKLSFIIFFSFFPSWPFYISLMDTIIQLHTHLGENGGENFIAISLHRVAIT